MAYDIVSHEGDNVITPHQARQVLYIFGKGGYPPGGFVQQLIETIQQADEQNRAKLALGFPGYVAAINLAQHTHGGIATLREIAGTRERGTPHDEELDS